MAAKAALLILFGSDIHTDWTDRRCEVKVIAKIFVINVLFDM